MHLLVTYTPSTYVLHSAHSPSTYAPDIIHSSMSAILSTLPASAILLIINSSFFPEIEPQKLE